MPQPKTPRRALLPWQLIRVSGPSMVPTLRSGDLVLVHHTAAITPGDVVLAVFDDLPDILVVKRAAEPLGPRWWVVSDNDAAGGDSRTHGPATVLGRVVLRWSNGRPGRLARHPLD